MRVKYLIFAISLTLLGINGNAQSEGPDILTDRPGQSSTPLLIPKGVLQIESGFAIEQDDAEGYNQAKYSFNSSLLKFGVNENFELRFNIEYLGVREELSDVGINHGFSPIALGVKIKLADAIGSWPQAAVISNVSLKTGAKEFTHSYTATDVTFAFSNEVSNKISVTYNTGLKWNGNSPEAVFLYTFSVAYAITNWWTAFGEVYGFFPEKHKADNRIDGGFTCKLSSTLQYDISGGLGLCKNSPDYFINTGLSIRLFK
jgi:hypothetical protein